MDMKKIASRPDDRYGLSRPPYRKQKHFISYPTNASDQIHIQVPILQSLGNSATICSSHTRSLSDVI